jgi:hypothetical protein
MVAIRRVPVAWTTGPGGAGVSVFYSLAADDATASLAAFFNTIKGAFPAAVTWAVPSSGDTIESTTGALTGSWSGGSASTITGGGSTAYAAGTGAYVRWYTNTIRNGRKFVGRTFLVPLLGSMYDTTGTIENANLGTFQTAANTLVGVGFVGVWGRPTTPGGSNGLWGQFTSAVVPDKVTSLRSRRT